MRVVLFLLFATSAYAQDRKALDEASAKAIDYCQAQLKSRGNNAGFFAEHFLTSLAILALGDDKYSIKEAVEMAMRDLPPGGNQHSWYNAFALLFLCEVYKKDQTEALKKRIPELIKNLETTQESTGGWSHHKGFAYNLPGKNVPDLCIVTGLVMAALGSAKNCKFEVSKTVLDRAINYCTQRTDGKGGLIYGTNNPVPDAANSRGALMMIGLSFMGQKNDLYGKAAQGVASRVSEVTRGHAFPPLHFFDSAVGCYVSGQFGAFKAERMSKIYQMREPDGSVWFKNHEKTDYERTQLQSNVIGTAVMALIFQLEKGNVFKPFSSGSKSAPGPAKNPFSQK